ncbi:MAG TPA: hypothetical protein VEA61_08830 [Allosphingosinicella sp.]|nr:hypothetical protein [Allosphingosinicella sp.]
MRDPDITTLSELLRSAHGEDACASTRLRNPHGVARKVWHYRALLDGRSSRSGSPLEQQVWTEFIAAPARLSELAQSALDRLTGASATPSRGPVPSFGEAVNERVDTGSSVYVAILCGVTLPPDSLLAKVGRSNDVSRRQKELNAALPVRAGIAWKMVRTWPLANSEFAHAAEQTILQSEAAAGGSAGGEFIVVKATELAALLARCERMINSVRGGKSICRVSLPHDCTALRGEADVAFRGRCR